MEPKAKRKQAELVRKHFSSRIEHLGVRVLNDSFPAPALNGPMSYDGWGVGKRKYVFRFSKASDSALTCADELATFLFDVGLPWFERFGSADSVLAPDGPLGDDSRRRLELALSGHRDEAAIAASRTMLGLKN